MNTRPKAVRPHRARNIILILLAIFVLAIVALPFVALPIASVAAKGFIENAIASGPNASASIGKIDLSWNGPQRITALQFTDPDQGIDASINASSSLGLRDFLSELSDFGQAHISGQATITKPASTQPSPTPTTSGKPSSPSTPKPITIPLGLALELVLEKFDLTLIAPDPADPSRTIESRWTDIEGAVRITDGKNCRAWIEAVGSAPDEKLSIDIRSNNFASPTGDLQLRSAETDLAIDAAISAQSLDAIRHFVSIPPEITADRNHLRVQGKFRDINGILTIADKAHPPFIALALSPEVIETIAPGMDAKPHPVTLALKTLVLPITDNPSQPIDLTKTSFECTILTNPIALPMQLNPGEPPQTVQINQIEITAKSERLSRGLDVFARGSTATDEQHAGSLTARVTLSRFLDDKGNLDPSAAIFYAEGALDSVPTSLLAPFVDPHGLSLTGGFGPLLNLSARIESQLFDSPDIPIEPRPIIATINVNGAHAKAAVGLRFVPGKSISQWEVPLNVQSFHAVAFAAPLIKQHGLDISGDGSFIAQISDFNLPLKPDNSPDLAAMTARYRFIIGDAFIRTAPDLPPINAELFDIEINVEADKPPRLALESRLVHEGSRATANARFDLNGYSAADPTNFDSLQPVGTLTAPNIPVDLLRLVSPDLADQARELLGQTITAKLTAPPPGGEQSRTLAHLELTAQNLAASALLSVENNKPSISELTADLTLSPETTRALLSRTGATPPLELAEPTTITLRVNDIAMGPAKTPFAPDAFRLDADATIPTLALLVPGDASGAGRLDLIDTALSIKSTPGQTINVTINANHLDAAHNPFTAQATISNFASTAGSPTPDIATINATANGDLPTPFIDAIASSTGTYTALLGPTATVDLTATNLTNNSGSLRATLNTDHANAELAGRIENGAFIADATTTAHLTRFTPEASKALFEKALPFLSSVEKTNEDDPAFLSIENLVVPLNGDLKQLAGVGKVDPGVIRFETSNLFSKVLKATHNKTIGSVGHKVEPINFTMDQGVIRYEEFTLPAGEFNIVTEGKVNLVSKKLDVLVSVPLFALSNEFAASIGQIPGLDRLTSVPIRFTGNTAKPKVNVDTELFLKSIPESLLGGLGNLGGSLGGGVENGAEGVGGLFDDVFKKIEEELSGEKDKENDEGGQSADDTKKKKKKKGKKKNKKKKDNPDDA